MTPTEVFSIASMIAMPMWILMIFLPTWKVTQFLIDFKIMISQMSHNIGVADGGSWLPVVK